MATHHRYDRERHNGESLNAAISEAMAAVVRDHTGQAPSAVKTTVRENTVIVTLQDTLTDGERDQAVDDRSAFEEAMRVEASSVVEGLTGRRVVAMVSADHIDSRSKGEILVLDATLDPEAPSLL